MFVVLTSALSLLLFARTELRQHVAFSGAALRVASADRQMCNELSESRRGRQLCLIPVQAIWTSFCKCVGRGSQLLGCSGQPGSVRHWPSSPREGEDLLGWQERRSLYCEKLPSCNALSCQDGRSETGPRALCSPLRRSCDRSQPWCCSPPTLPHRTMVPA